MYKIFLSAAIMLTAVSMNVNAMTSTKTSNQAAQTFVSHGDFDQNAYETWLSTIMNEDTEYKIHIYGQALESYKRLTDDPYRCDMATDYLNTIRKAIKSGDLATMEEAMQTVDKEAPYLIEEGMVFYYKTMFGW